MKICRAFTLTETIIVASICALLAAVSLPVYSSVRRHSSESRSMSNMHQLYLALSMYETNWEPSQSTGGVGGDLVASLGLPPNLTALQRDQRLPAEVFSTGGETTTPGGFPLYIYMPPDPQTSGQVLLRTWQNYYRSSGANAVILVDDTHGNELLARLHGFVRHHLIALHLDGHITKKDGMGDYSSYDFWY